MRTRAAESAGDVCPVNIDIQAAFHFLASLPVVEFVRAHTLPHALPAVELETRTQAFALERDAAALAATEAAACIKALQTAAAAAEAQVAQQARELQESKASHPKRHMSHSMVGLGQAITGHLVRHRSLFCCP